jgi:hypothetical protein
LADAIHGVLPPIPDQNLRALGDSSAVGMTTPSMDGVLKNLLGEQYSNRFGNGVYVLVDRGNVLYAP